MSRHYQQNPTATSERRSAWEADAEESGYVEVGADEEGQGDSRQNGASAEAEQFGWEESECAIYDNQGINFSGPTAASTADANGTLRRAPKAKAAETGSIFVTRKLLKDITDDISKMYLLSQAQTERDAIEEAIKVAVKEMNATGRMLLTRESPSPYRHAVAAVAKELSTHKEAYEIAGAIVELVSMHYEQKYATAALERRYTDMQVALCGESLYADAQQPNVPVNAQGVPLYSMVHKSIAPVYDMGVQQDSIYALATMNAEEPLYAMGGDTERYGLSAQRDEQLVQQFLETSPDTRYPQLIQTIREHYRRHYSMDVPVTDCVAGYGRLKALGYRVKCLKAESVTEAYAVFGETGSSSEFPPHAAPAAEYSGLYGQHRLHAQQVLQELLLELDANFGMRPHQRVTALKNSIQARAPSQITRSGFEKPSANIFAIMLAYAQQVQHIAETHTLFEHAQTKNAIAAGMLFGVEVFKQTNPAAKELANAASLACESEDGIYEAPQNTQKNPLWLLGNQLADINKALKDAQTKNLRKAKSKASAATHSLTLVDLISELGSYYDVFAANKTHGAPQDNTLPVYTVIAKLAPQLVAIFKSKNVTLNEEQACVILAMMAGNDGIHSILKTGDSLYDKSMRRGSNASSQESDESANSRTQLIRQNPALYHSMRSMGGDGYSDVDPSSDLYELASGGDKPPALPGPRRAKIGLMLDEEFATKHFMITPAHQKQLEQDTMQFIHHLRQTTHPKKLSPAEISSIAQSFVAYMVKYYRSDSTDGVVPAQVSFQTAWTSDSAASSIIGFSNPNYSHTGGPNDMQLQQLTNGQSMGGFESKLVYRLVFVNAAGNKQSAPIDFNGTRQDTYQQIDNGAMDLIASGYEQLFRLPVNKGTLLPQQANNQYLNPVIAQSALANFVDLIAFNLQSSSLTISKQSSPYDQMNFDHLPVKTQDQQTALGIFCLCCCCAEWFKHGWYNPNKAERKAFRIKATLIIGLSIAAVVAIAAAAAMAQSGGGDGNSGEPAIEGSTNTTPAVPDTTLATASTTPAAQVATTSQSTSTTSTTTASPTTTPTTAPTTTPTTPPTTAPTTTAPTAAPTTTPTTTPTPAPTTSTTISSTAAPTTATTTPTTSPTTTPTSAPTTTPTTTPATNPTTSTAATTTSSSSFFSTTTTRAPAVGCEGVQSCADAVQNFGVGQGNWCCVDEVPGCRVACNGCPTC